MINPFTSDFIHKTKVSTKFLAKNFNINHFTFLRKCVSIKKEFELREQLITKFEIRNIPSNSNRYWLCFPEACIAHAYEINRDEQGEITEIICCSEINFQNEVDDNIDLAIDKDKELYPYDLNNFPTAYPKGTEIYVYEDERLSFKPSFSFFIKKEKAQTAINELKNNQGKYYLNVEQIREWLNKYNHFYWSLQLHWNYKTFSEFFHLYSHLQHIKDVLKNEPTARQAVKEYTPLNDEWSIKYDRYYFCNAIIYHNEFIVWSEDPFIIEHSNKILYLVGEEFKYLYQFSVMFERELKRNRK